MLWEEVIQVHPNKWLVSEALQAHSNNNYRIVDDIAISDIFDDSMKAFHRHAELHKKKPNRELYFFHTSREKLNIHEQK